MKNYIQSDPQWASYPYASENMALAGCGPTSVADCLSLVSDVLPTEVADYITSIGGASDGCGTYWEGITAAVNHFGMECTQLNDYSLYGTVDSAEEQEWLAKMKTGNYVGILLMGGGFFCRAGHYIAVESVREDNTIQVFDVAFSPRSVSVNWYDNAPASAMGNALGETVPYFRGRVKVFYLIKKNGAPAPVQVPAPDPRAYRCTFKQIEPGMQDMPEIYIWQELMTAAGYYNLPLDFSFGPALADATLRWKRDHVSWIQKTPFEQNPIVTPAVWRAAMHMTGSRNGSEISFILRAKEIGETGTTCRFVQNIAKARGFYPSDIDDSCGMKNAEANIEYKKALGFSETSGAITIDLLKDMCGGC